MPFKGVKKTMFFFSKRDTSARGTVTFATDMRMREQLIMAAPSTPALRLFSNTMPFCAKVVLPFLRMKEGRRAHIKWSRRLHQRPATLGTITVEVDMR